MQNSEAFVVGEEWIGEHYFTSDSTKDSFQARVLERRKEWEEDGDSTRARFTSSRSELERLFASVSESVEDAEDAEDGAQRTSSRVDEATRAAQLRAREQLPARLLEVLGYTGGQYVHTTDGPLDLVGNLALPEARKLALVHARPALDIESVLPKDAPTLAQTWVRVEDGKETPIRSVASALTNLATMEDGPEFFLVLAGRWLVVSDRERWLEGRYLGVDLQLVAERADAKRGGEIERALTILEAASLAPDAEGNIWWTTTLEQSVQHTVGVSKELQVGVRESIEIIANDVVARRAAKGLEPLPQSEAQELAVQSLRYLYRILFLLYAEASPEMGVLPKGAPAYDEGYGLERLRELALVELTNPREMAGTHLYDSIEVLVRQLRGAPRPIRDDGDGLDFQSLDADLFKAEKTAHIDAVKLGNAAMLEVLRKLLLTKESAKKQRGFISYAELGINQLGAVYEGLMSYTGFFAEADLYEVAKGGDPSGGSWVVPVDSADHLDPKDFVTYRDELGDDKRVIHRRGEFVYRLSGRDRQRSASYYTPEVLTKFTVSQALEELLGQDGRTTTAEEILNLTICEPALGSGAFAIEAVRQLAAEYLKRRETELGERVDPETRALELQKVKAHIALHQTYGVDLNATAVELAEVSLWLDTMVTGLQAPWFGLRLRRGNSLVGARRETYRAAQLVKKAWLKTTPTPRPLADARLDGDEVGEWIHHFLLPAQGWGSAVEVPKAVRDLADPQALADLKKWRSSVRVQPTAEQTQRLIALGRRVEQLWGIALRRLQIAEAETGRSIDLWGRPAPDARRVVTRAEVEAYLSEPNTAYQRLRTVMDAWCSLWFWPFTETETAPPSFAEWLSACEGILGIVKPDPDGTWTSSRIGTRKPAVSADQIAADGVAEWAQLNQLESDDARMHAMRDRDDLMRDFPWLEVCHRTAAQQGFFHWELDFATVFARGGFDLQVGNPPWVRPDVDVEALLAESDPWWATALKPSESQKEARREVTLSDDRARTLVLDGVTEVVALAEVLTDTNMYPLLSGRPDLYRAFMCAVWAHQGTRQGVSGLIHMETHFTDEKAEALRGAAYRRLRRHWQYVNELSLFDIDHHVAYGVNVYGSIIAPHFLQAASLYHPATIEPSLRHQGAGPEPGLKDPDGQWDLRPHKSRVQTVDERVLGVWADIMGVSTTDAPPMVYTINSTALHALAVLAEAERLQKFSLLFSAGWNERTDRERGRFESGWGSARWRDAILQGPHLHVSTPLYKTPNESMKNNLDWSSTDLEDLAADALPVTAYKPAGDRAVYDAQYTHWEVDGERVPARDYYRVAWRAMAANTGERTLIPAIIPPGAAHVHPVATLGLPTGPVSTLAAVAGTLSSLLADFAVRSAPKSAISPGSVNRLAMVPLDHPLVPQLVLRTLRLNCVTDVYADLWRECWREEFRTDSPILERFDERPISQEWSADTPLRRAVDRRNAQVEIDALVALMLNVPVEDLCTIYRSQFAVLYGYDQREYTYDANGRLVPNSVLSRWRKLGAPATDAEMSEADRTATHPGSGIDYVYALPFATRDREADLRTTYAEFERRLGELG